MNETTAARLARILALLAQPPRLRNRPEAGDLAGPFQQWFDGGAWREEGRARVWAFADGSTAWQELPGSLLALRVVLRDGTAVDVREVPRALPATTSCAGCGRPIEEGQTHVVMGGRSYHVACVPRH